MYSYSNTFLKWSICIRIHDFTIRIRLRLYVLDPMSCSLLEVLFLCCVEGDMPIDEVHAGL